MDHKVNRQLGWFLSLPMLILLYILGFIPIMFPLLSQYEGVVFPVVKNVEIEVQGEDDEKRGLFVTATFDKVRSCEFIGLSWYDSFGDRSPIVFQKELTGQIGEEPRTRPVLDGQKVGPWHLISIHSLDGSVAIVAHRCNPFWITYTRFYP